MRFGEVPLGEARGAILAHSLRVGGAVLKKGRVLSLDDVAAIAAAEFAAQGGKLLQVAAFVPRRVALIQTRLPGLKESILDKTRQVTEQRLAALGSTLAAEERCNHTTADLAPRIAAATAAGADL